MIGLVLFQAAVIILIAYYILLPVVIYFNDPKKLRRFPSVSLSAFSNSWMVIHQYLCSRTIAIHLAHQKYGPVVRIGTDHISLSSQQAIKDIYGHGTPTRKDNFYKAYVGTHLNVSDSQDKAVHGAKRKRFAVAFAQKSITELEYVVTDHLEKLIKKLDQKCFETSTMTEKGSLRLTNQQGEVIDLKLWLSFLTLDINSVLLYSTDFTFLDKESTVTTAETINGKLYEADVKRAIWESNHISTSLGWAPRALQLNKFLTKWHRGWKDGAAFRDINIHLIRKRLAKESERVAQGGKPYDDFFSTVLWDQRSREPLGLEFGELVAEASNLLTGGSENIEIAIIGLIYHLARNPKAAARLRAELDAAILGNASNPEEDVGVPAYDEIKDLPYLRACIDESLRLRLVLTIGLPRVVPPEGLLVDGHWLEGNTTVSVSTYTIHRDPKYFHDPDQFLPERWLEPGAEELQRVFLAFQQGGRACIGRNIAYLEMQLILTTLVRRYEFELAADEKWQLKTFESIMGHTGELPIKLRKRDLTV